ncbi:MAG: MlaD family protein [Actinomycetota bacterium]|nr:MlaD family protein [Actinomycetota bacterium]
MKRSPAQVLASSPTLVGAVTTLIAIVTVFLAYNANQGLPFVPVYKVSVDVPNGARVGNNNEIRIGGTRVGVVESIEPVVNNDSALTAQADGAPDTSVAPVSARLNLKLDKSAAPIPKDSIFRIRYRSAFGLKYLEIVRGTGSDAPEGFVFNGLDDGEICALPVDPEKFSEESEDPARNGCFQSQNEFDSVNNTFDARTRRAGRDNLVGYGGGFAARGPSLNDTFQTLAPFFTFLKPVAEVLSDPATRFDRFFPALARTQKLVAPVAVEQAEQFAFAAIAFAAITSDAAKLQETIEEGPPTLETGISLLPAQREFLRKFALVSHELRPGVRDLRTALPALNEAIEVGTPVLATSPQVNRRLEGVFRELNQLVRQPTTQIAIDRLATTFDTARPLAEYVVPAQTVCNYWNYWFTFVPNGLSDRDQVGHTFRQTLTRFPAAPLLAESGVGGYSGIGANGKAGTTDPGVFKPYEIPITNTHPYGPTGQRNADCQPGQAGNPLGRIRVPGQPRSSPANRVSDLPGSRGPTTLFYGTDQKRSQADTRIPGRAPETWRRLGR